MIDFLLHALKAHPEVAIFLSIALGTLIGRLHFGFFHLGSVAGSLLAGLLIGQLGVEIPALLKSVFFAMFIYAVGFKSGPEFFGSLNRGTLKLVVLSAFLCVVGLGCILLMSHVFRFDQGFAVGLGAGALTDTAMLGTGSGALNMLPLDAAQIRELNSHMAVSYAITYLIGTIGMILFVGAAAPRLLKVDLKASAREFEAQLAGGSAVPPQDQVSLYTSLVTRALRVAPDSACVGQAIGQIEQRHGGVSIERVLRAGRVLERELSLVLAAGDIVGVAAQCGGVAALHRAFGEEVDEPAAMSYPAKSAEVVLTRRDSRPAIGSRTRSCCRAAAEGASASRAGTLRAIMASIGSVRIRPSCGTFASSAFSRCFVVARSWRTPQRTPAGDTIRSCFRSSFATRTWPHVASSIASATTAASISGATRFFRTGWRFDSSCSAVSPPRVAQLLEPIEAVAALAHDLAGLGHVAELLRQLQQPDLHLDDLLVLAHPRLLLLFPRSRGQGHRGPSTTLSGQV
jgi:AspT/YidE/YbjL antiporter-like protein